VFFIGPLTYLHHKKTNVCWRKVGAAFGVVTKGFRNVWLHSLWHFINLMFYEGIKNNMTHNTSLNDYYAYIIVNMVNLVLKTL